MKKTILTVAFAASALFASAQGIKSMSPGYAVDNFKTTTEVSDAVDNNLGIFFYKDSINTAIPTDSLKVGDVRTIKGTGTYSQKTVRLGNGSLDFTYSQPYNKFINTGFQVGKGKSIDIATNPKFKIEIASSSNEDIYFKINLKDAMGNILDSKGSSAKKSGDWYKDEFGFILGSTGASLSSNASPVLTSAITISNSAGKATITFNFGGGYRANYGTGKADSTSFDFTKVSEVQLTPLSNKQNDKDGSYDRFSLKAATFAISYVGLGDFVTSINEDATISNSNEVVSVYDMMGKFVATGKLNELGLEAGKLYVVKSGNKSRKIVMN